MLLNLDSGIKSQLLRIGPFWEAPPPSARELIFPQISWLIGCPIRRLEGGSSVVADAALDKVLDPVFDGVGLA